jgi:hypothetical protein
MEMKPFNDSVQPGDPLIYGPTGEEYYFVGTTKAGNVVAERETCSYALTLDRENVFLPPKQTTYWVPVFRDIYGEPYFGNAYKSPIEAERDVRYEHYESIIPITLPK